MAQIEKLTAVPATPSGALHPIAPSRLHPAKGRPDMVAVGTIIWLASELMFFAALFAVYFSMRNVTNAMVPAGEQTMWQWGSEHFMNTWFGIKAPWFSILNTTVLVLSSVTCQIGVMKAEHGQVGRTGSIFNVSGWGLREWYTLTFLMGAFFIGGQAFEYSNLAAEGFVPSTNSYSSAFFVATGFHGLHVLGGLIAFLLMLGRTFLARRFTHEQAVHAVVTSYYWHFVDVVWIILFAVIYLIR